MTAKELRERRLALGYSVTLMAEILQMSSARLEEWEAGTLAIDDPAFLRHAFDALIRAHHASAPVKSTRSA